MSVLAKLGHVSRNHNLTLDLVPTASLEPLGQPSQPFLLLRIVCGEDKALRFRIVKSSSLAVHHELLRTVEINRLPAFGVVLINWVSNKARHFGLADGKLGRIALAELAMGFFGWKEEERSVCQLRRGPRCPLYLAGCAHRDGASLPARLATCVGVLDITRVDLKI